MENNRGQSIFLSVVGIATLLVAIVGATFAYFSISVRGNETASSIKVTTAKVGGVNFNGQTAGVEVTNAYPGWSSSKQFSISTDEGTDPTAEIVYGISLIVENGQLATAAPAGEFIYSLTGSGSCGTLAANVTDQDLPATTPANGIGSGTLVGECTHTYTFDMELVETNVPQNDLQGKSYFALIQITVADDQGLRTWDDQRSTWKPWTAPAASSNEG